jgi:hypothetical protein
MYYQNGDLGQRLASIESRPNVRPAAPITSARDMAKNAASLLEGVQGHAPLANM